MKVIENFLSEETISYLIDYHKDNFDLNNNLSKKHRNTEVIMCEKDSGNFKEIETILNNFIKKINKNYVINYFEIVKWPCGESQKEHFDFEYHPYTTILYLNDDFEGGETVVGHKYIIPEKNKLVGFEGNKIIHKVNEIKKGSRYTLPCWYRYEF
jgi:hypothetical protein